jgi:hypothetical protein
MITRSLAWLAFPINAGETSAEPGLVVTDGAAKANRNDETTIALNKQLGFKGSSLVQNWNP